MRRMLLSCAAIAVIAGAPVTALAEVMTFKLLPNYSRATFKSDAPLETFVGNTAAEGIQGTLTTDPLRPQDAKGTVRVDMNLVRTGIDKRDADMRAKNYLDTEVETVKQKPVPRTADATVTWIKLTPEQVEAQKRWGFTADNVKVRAKFLTTFTDHGIQLPQIFVFKVNNEIQLETDLTFIRAQ